MTRPLLAQNFRTLNQKRPIDPLCRPVITSNSSYYLYRLVVKLILEQLSRQPEQ